MKEKNKREREFFERSMTKNILSKEKLFLFKADHVKKPLKHFRDDLFSNPIMDEDLKEQRKAKMLLLCEHFATIAKNRDDENLFHFWPKYLRYFMTPKLFDLVPISWFTQEFGFCFACKHFKGHKKGHHKFFHSIGVRRIISLFGRCEKNKSPKKFGDASNFNNHIMPTYRCRGWEPDKLYEQLLRVRLLQLLNDPKNGYSYKEFLDEQDKIDVLGFMCEEDG